MSITAYRLLGCAPTSSHHVAVLQVIYMTIPPGTYQYVSMKYDSLLDRPVVVLSRRSPWGDVCGYVTTVAVHPNIDTIRG